MSLSTSEVASLYQKYVIGNYTRMPLSIARGEGSYVWDAEGRCYLDLITGLAVSGLGHCHPKVVAALREQAGKLLHIHNNFLWEQQARLAQALSLQTTGMGEAKAFFCNSGTEATEAGIKIARLWGKAHGGRWKILSLENSFHGRTLGGLSATGQTVYQRGLGPLVPGFSYVPQNDVRALERAFDGDLAAFIAEPIQGEGGICPCTAEFLQAARELCTRHEALLLYDEVQCGLGRTGRFYAYQALGAPAPDVLWLAKTLGGGFPLGATLARPEAAALLVPGTHASTFGGNPLGCAAGLAVVETVGQERFLEQVRALGEHLGAGLEGLRARFPAKTRAVRRVGLMAALELAQPGKPVVDLCRAKGLLVNCTHDAALRFLPAMTITREQLDEALRIVGEALAEV